MKAVIYTIVVAILCKGFEEVVALSAGAPSSACANLMPNPTSHGAQPQSSAVPYSIDLSPFNNSYGGYEYYPGQTYNCKNITVISIASILNFSFTLVHKN